MTQKQTDPNATLSHEKSSLFFDRDKNEMYRPQDEGIEHDSEIDAKVKATGKQVPEDDPYENPLNDETHEQKTNEKTVAGVLGAQSDMEPEYDEEDEDLREEDARPRETVNSIK